MKSCKSELAKQILGRGIRLPLKPNSVFEFDGKTYRVKHIPTRPK